MTNEQTGDQTPPEGGDSTPQGVDFGLLFQEGAELPEELKPLADHRDSLKQYLDSQIGESVTRTQTEVMSRIQQQQEAERQRTANQAKVQEDIDWAKRLEDDMFSGDAEKAAAAKAERDREADRYSSAMAAKFSMARDQVRHENVSEFLSGIFEDTVKNGEQAIIDALTPEFIQQHGGNPLRASIAAAKAAGERAGYERGLAEGQQISTAERGAEGQRGTPPPDRGGNNGSKLTEGVTLGAPGSTRTLRQRWSEATAAAKR